MKSLKFRDWLVYLLGAILIFLFYHAVVISLIGQYISSEKSTFASENAKLGDPFGINNLRLDRTCYTLERSYSSTRVQCGTYAKYKNSMISAASYNSFKDHLESNLRTNGWIADNPAELAASQDKLLNVAFHKNLGPVSCNLEISSETSYGIFINIYSCTRNTNWPDLNLSHTVYGP